MSNNIIHVNSNISSRFISTENISSENILSDNVDVNDAFSALNEPTGFVDGSTQTSTFIGGTTRQYTISATGSEFNVYVQSVKYTKTTDNITITDTDGLHLIYYNNSGELAVTENPTVCGIKDVMTNYAICAYIIWDASGNQSIYFSKDNAFHLSQMDNSTLFYIHSTIGSTYAFGMEIEDINTNEDGDVNTDAQFGVAAGGYHNEDICIQTAAISYTIGLPIFYLDGPDPGVLRKATVSGFSILNDDGLGGGDERVLYNQFTGGNWTQTEVTDKDFVLYHIFATTDPTMPYISIQGQNEYSNASDARSGATTEINSLHINEIYSYLVNEMIPIATVIFQTNDTYLNDVKARIRDTINNEDYVDWRQIQILPNGISGITDHGYLDGLSGDDHEQYVTLENRGGETLDIDKIIVSDMAAGTGSDVVLNGSDELVYVTSIRESKTNIQTLSSIDTSWIYNIDVKKYNYRLIDDDKNYTDVPHPQLHTGLIADDLELIDTGKKHCTYRDGKLSGISYTSIVPDLIAEVQRLNMKIRRLEDLLDKTN